MQRPFSTQLLTAAGMAKMRDSSNNLRYVWLLAGLFAKKCAGAAGAALPCSCQAAAGGLNRSQLLTVSLQSYIGSGCADQPEQVCAAVLGR